MTDLLYRSTASTVTGSAVVLMSLLAAMGDAQEALPQHGNFAAVSYRALGVDPTFGIKDARSSVTMPIADFAMVSVLFEELESPLTPEVQAYMSAHIAAYLD